MTFGDKTRAINQTATILSDTILTSLLDDAEDEIRRELEANGLSINPSPAPYDLKTCANNWLCRNILRRHKVDGTAPNSLTLGSTTTAVAVDASIADYDAKGREALDRYIASMSTADGLDDDCLVTTTGED